MMRRAVAALSAWLLIILMVVPGAAAEGEEPAGSESTAGQLQQTQAGNTEDSLPYRTYIKRYTDSPAGTGTAETPASLYMENRGAVLTPKEEAGNTYLEWTGGKGEVDWTLQVPADGLYRIGIRYLPLEGGNGDIQLGVLLDGEYPYEEMREVRLNRWWKNEGDVRVDSRGDEFSPVQGQDYRWDTKWLMDSNGVEPEPLLVYLTAGEHRLTLVSLSEPFAIESVALAPPEEIPSYEDYIASFDSGTPDYSGEQRNIQGEDADLKSSVSLMALSDMSTADATPSDTEHGVLNYIGGANWQRAGDTLYWSVDVPESGFYTIYFKYRQSYLLNGESYRSFAIDGTVPFQEAAEISFPYSTGWEVKALGDKEGNPYKVYLQKGPAVFSLSVTMGPQSTIYNQLQEVAYDLGEIYRRISMVVGDSPDPNRDYNLFGQIPDLEERLTANMNALNDLAARLEDMAGIRGGSGPTTLRNMAGTIQRMLNYSWQAQKYKSDYYGRYSGVSAYLNEMKSMPLDLDETMLVAPGAKVDPHMAGFFEGVTYSFKRFISSFMADYSTFSSAKGGDELTVWVYWGRDQSRVLDFMIRDMFTTEYGTTVHVQVVNATLVQAMLSGKTPDVVLTMSRTQPVNMAMRGVLYDLSTLPGFEELVNDPAQYMPGATLPYEYNGGCYALPDTQLYYMLFSRTDVLAEMGLEVPKTWDEFLAAVTMAQRYNLQVGIPYARISDVATMEVGIGALNLFPTFLNQFGGQMYNDTHTATALTEPEAVQAFTYWTELYTKYRLPIDYDFSTRFRTGEMPMAIATYDQYAMLSVAAPEITGRWEMSEIPGMLKEDGTIDNSSAGGGTGCVILKDSQNVEKAWEFLKWWVSADAQYRYASDLEAVLGISARPATANVTAFSRLSWAGNGLETMLGQWSKVREIPEVPGGYFTSRAIDQAYWNTAYMYKKPRDMLIKWSKEVDNEITRKRQEYHLDG